MRVKRAGSKRYVYLVEGARKGRRVKQRNLCYLGPLTKLAAGVPDDIRRRAEERVQTVDWLRVNAAIRRVPLTFEELTEANLFQYAVSVRARQRRPRRGKGGGRPRARSELEALTRLARAGFDELFEQVGNREYRMRDA